LPFGEKLDVDIGNVTKVERYVFYGIGLVVWLYLGLRTAFVPLVHDEVFTYFTYIRDATFIPPWSHWDANNHFLNSALEAILTRVFGHSSFVIRMVSWFAFVPFVFVLGQFSDHLDSKLKRWMLVLPLISTPYFIELFGLSRGYGLSISLLLCTLLLTFRYTSKPSKKKALWISLFGLLSSLASLSVIVTVMIIYGWVWIVQLRQYKSDIVKISIRWFFTFIAPLVPLIYYVFLLKERGLLYYGHHSVMLSLRLLADLLLTSRGYSWVWIASLICVIAVYGFYIRRKGWGSLWVQTNIFVFTFLFSLMAIFLQHFLLDVKYPSDRAVIHLFILLIFSLVFLPISRNNKIWRASLCLLAFFPIHLILSMNITYSKFWIYEHLPQRFVEEVRLGSNNDFPPTVNASNLRSYIWAYQQLDQGYYPSTINSIEHPNEWADYVLVDSNQTDFLNLERFTMVDYDSVSGQSLLKQKFPNVELVKRDTILRNVKIENEYTNIFDFKGSDWIGKPMAMYFNVDVEASSEIMHLLIISSVFDSNGVEVYTNKYSFSRVSENWMNKKDWKIKVYLPPFPKNVARFVTYIYNPNKEHHVFPQIQCKLAEIHEGSMMETAWIDR